MAQATLASPLHVSPAEFDPPDWLKTYLSLPHAPATEGSLYPDGLTDTAPRSYTRADIDLICRAFEFAYHLHARQVRKSGEPYIAHPVAVAGLLRDLGGDAVTVAAGFLHDVVEDTDVTLENIERQFGLEVRILVEGVTKLSKFNFSSKTEQQAENFRRMFVSMAKDIRVIVVKLADRLHNMRTLQFLPEEKQKQISAETMDIFAPLANRLGMWNFKWELEDLAFKYLDYDAYRSIQELINAKRTEREEEILSFIGILKNELDNLGIHNPEISGRPKHIYGIYRKMQKQKKEFAEIFDLSAVRVIVQTNEDCYRVLSAVHGKFRPVPNRFKDYIGLPKRNLYQSIHTAVVGSSGRPVEVQIRTFAMHHVAEYGIAAHWKYKESGSTVVKAHEEKFTWLRQLLEWQHDLTDDKEYLDTIRENLFESEVYIFTPKGDLISLPQGSCPVDFAYRIHSKVGDHCAGAKVNNKMVPLDTPLQTGDFVQIITQKQAHPSLDWINFVATSTAKNRIRQWYKRSHREQNILRGRQLLERELGKTGLESLLKSERMFKVAEKLNHTTIDDLLASLGHGEITVTMVTNRLQENTKSDSLIPTAFLNRLSLTPSLPSPATDSIVGLTGLKHHLAKCCNPLPGDPILGVVTLLNPGITIHHHGCPNLAKVTADRLIPVSWNEDEDSTRGQVYPVNLRLKTIDRVGILKDILQRLSDNNINVRNAQVTTHANGTALIKLCIDVKNSHQFKEVVSRLRQLSDVLLVHTVQPIL
ncbi:MAG: bifunctional (p)ppGpp synthetase/guanosine-3',5'-bis(diphosphate) 3'-pyrophosphohydrolase [Cyanobacteriota bacterium]|nr:bifunctional (p)ppGpp synthetase/guanosine-3',5'-bis(diphosphate) 3'-pyrophosphohydrolase [Cyanobacteriota bacterium]